MSTSTKRVCQQCGTEFFVAPSQIKHGRGKYCSRECYHLSRWVPRVDCICKACGKVFQLKESTLRARDGSGTYCSRACRDSGTGKISVKCDWCGAPIEDYPSQLEGKNHHFCDMRCYGKWMAVNRKGENHPNWKPREQKVCGTCGKSYGVEPHRINSKFCSQKCAIEQTILRNKTMELHPRWLGGKSFEPYPPEFNERFKKTIRGRDGYTCAICGKEGNQVHHIDYDKKNTVPENCITLCKSCHAKTNGKRGYWQQRLEELMTHKKGEQDE